MTAKERLATAGATVALTAAGLAVLRWGPPETHAPALAFVVAIANALPSVWKRIESTQPDDPKEF